MSPSGDELRLLEHDRPWVTDDHIEHCNSEIIKLRICDI
jgi:hypothetical protein